MANSDTKTQQYLDIAAHGTRAQLPSSNCCNTRTQDLIVDVAERIMDVEDEVAELKNNPDVADIVATYADLEDYDTSKLTNNAIVRVLEDEEHDGASTYYRYSTATQEFTYIGEVGPYYTEDEVDALLAGKQDTLTAGTNIQISNDNVISATDTTYTAGTGLNLSGTEFSVDTTTIQEKLTAGTNVTISSNTISATDTTYSNFTGTDGTAAGTAGLVPAPATTDAGKYLKADGTWGVVPSGPTVVQVTGSSTTDVMSQKAVTDIIGDIASALNAINNGTQS